MSRKKLKKEIKKAFNILYTDLVFYITFVEGADREKAKDVFFKIPAIEQDIISKISVNEGKKVKGRVKKYYNALVEETNIKINEIVDEISNLS